MVAHHGFRFAGDLQLVTGKLDQLGQQRNELRHRCDYREHEVLSPVQTVAPKLRLASPCQIGLNYVPNLAGCWLNVTGC